MVHTNAEQCPKYENCEAPLCPLDLEKKQPWYIDEDVCKLPEHKELPWVVLQRKLKSKRSKDPEKEWSYEELLAECKERGMLKKVNSKTKK